MYCPEERYQKKNTITFSLSKDPKTGKIHALCNVKDITESYNKQLHIEEMTKAAELSEAIATIKEALGSGSWSMEFDENAQMVSCTWSDTFRRMVGAQSKDDYPDTDGLKPWGVLQEGQTDLRLPIMVYSWI